MLLTRNCTVPILLYTVAYFLCTHTDRQTASLLLFPFLLFTLVFFVVPFVLCFSSFTFSFRICHSPYCGGAMPFSVVHPSPLPPTTPPSLSLYHRYSPFFSSSLPSPLFDSLSLGGTHACGFVDLSTPYASRGVLFGVCDCLSLPVDEESIILVTHHTASLWTAGRPVNTVKAMNVNAYLLHR